MTKASRPNASVYREPFLENNGRRPWPCYFCGEDVTELAVHHIDEDPWNNKPENLAAMHLNCHGKHHAKNRTFSQETRRKISEGTKGRVRTPEHRANLSKSLKGKWTPKQQAAALLRRKRTLTDEHKGKIRDGLKRAYAEGRR